MASILQFPSKASAAQSAETLWIHREALCWERRNGRDAYSAFLLKHGKRPSPRQAEVIGKIVGRRVKADDGLRYPKLNQVEKATQRAALRSKNDDRKKWEHIKRLHRAFVESDRDLFPT